MHSLKMVWNCQYYDWKCKRNYTKFEALHLKCNYLNISHHRACLKFISFQENYVGEIHFLNNSVNNVLDLLENEKRRNGPEKYKIIFWHKETVREQGYLIQIFRNFKSLLNSFLQWLLFFTKILLHLFAENTTPWITSLKACFTCWFLKV
jgi:hypothetical protein